MITRDAEKFVLILSKKYPVLFIAGPRQSGKTTLARKLFPKKSYVTLEDPDQRSFALEDPKGFLKQFPEGAILDEIQRAPILCSYIQGIVDTKKTLFVLTGSQQFEISQTISQSLSGRVGILKLLPLSLRELCSYKKVSHWNRLLLEGFYPRLHVQKIKPSMFYPYYFETYVERDLRQLSQIENLSVFEKFVRLMAGRVGSLLNHSALSVELGVSQPTIRKWTTLLEASFIIFLLPAFSHNRNKRLVKTPKVYFYDVGLATYLLGIEEKKHLDTHPLRGALFENFIVLEYLKNRFHQGMRSNLYFYRDKSGHEVDLVLESGNTLQGVEIKSGMTSQPDWAKKFFNLRPILPILKKTCVVYGGDSTQNYQQVPFFSWKDFFMRMS
jgi:predicted AAA+ superfamily ATPase